MVTRLQRLISIEREIRCGRYPSVTDFCSMFCVKPRTVYNDIRILRDELGSGIQFDRLRKGYYNPLPEQKIPLFELTRDEVRLLACALQLLFNLRAEVRPAVLDLKSKLSSMLPPGFRSEFDDSIM